MADIKHIPCGACGADLPQFAGVPRVSEEAKIVTTGWESVRVVQCTQCGFYYADPMSFWDGGDLQVLYNEEYFSNESVWWHHVRTEVDPKRRLDIIARQIEMPKPRLLDIGCGQGYMLEKALQRGWNVWGLEPSKTWAQNTEARLGVKVWSQPVEKVELPAGSCDIVFSDSVIEHLPEPMTMMKLARRVLKPGGIAYLVTPNADSLVNHFRGIVSRLTGSKRSPYIEPLCSPYHVVGFTPNSLSVLAKRAGFEVRHVWIQHGVEEWRKEKRWNTNKFKSLALLPLLLAGEITRRGTTIETMLVAQY